MARPELYGCRARLALAAVVGAIALAIVAVSSPRLLRARRRRRVSRSRRSSRRRFAPGVRVALSGFAGGDRPVRVLVRGSVAARTTSGTLGHFRLHFAAPAAGAICDLGRERRSRDARRDLTTRAVTLAAVGDMTSGEQVGASVSTLGPVCSVGGCVGPLLRKADIATANLEGSSLARLSGAEQGVPLPRPTRRSSARLTPQAGSTS